MLLIQNAKIYTMAGEVLPQGDLLLKDGKIAAIGERLTASDAQVIDASGLVATPGLVDAHAHFGGFKPTESDSDDLNEMTDPVSPQVRAIDGVDPHDVNLQYAHKSGITTACITPGSGNIVAGTAFTAKLYGEDIRKTVLKDPCALKLALGINPKKVYGPKGRAPMTRMGIAAILFDAFRQADDYRKALDEAGDDPSKRPAYHEKWEAMLPALRGEIPLKVHCEQFDMLTTIELAKKYNLSYSIEHCWAADCFYDELEHSGANIFYGPVGVPTGYGELTGADISFVKELDRRGLNVSLITDGPIFSGDVLMIQAGEAVRCGVDHLRALAMVTCNPARGLHIEDRVGTLEPGKDGDVVLWSGEPALDTSAHPRYTVIDGKLIYKA